MRWDRWTEEREAKLRFLISKSLPNARIAWLMGTTTAAINVHKGKQGYVVRGTRCLQCHKPIQQKPLGRPRQFCNQECTTQHRRARDYEARRRGDGMAESSRLPQRQHESLLSPGQAPGSESEGVLSGVPGGRGLFGAGAEDE